VSTYHPPANRMIERGYKPITDALAKLTDRGLRSWADTVLGGLQMGGSALNRVEIPDLARAGMGEDYGLGRASSAPYETVDGLGRGPRRSASVEIEEADGRQGVF